MIKCTGYRFKSYHGDINGNRIDSDKLIFSYLSDEEYGLVGWEAYTLEIKAPNPQILGEKLKNIFGVSISTDQFGNLMATGLDQFIKQPIIISCKLDRTGKATVSRIILDPSQPATNPKGNSKP
jgi:hypothetical protein